MAPKTLLIWLTGLSGSGKTSIARELYRLWNPEHPNLVLLDGDELRALLSPDLSYSDAHRRENARRISALCHYLVGRNLHVICPTMSLYHVIQEANRKALQSRYIEIYLHCDMQELLRRDPKGLYAAARSGARDDVVGINLPFEKPLHADLEIDTTASENVLSSAMQIYDRIKMTL